MPTDPSFDNEHVISEHGELVWRVIVRVLGENGELAEECFQETFTQFLERCRGGATFEHTGAMLARIASRRAIDAIRSRVRDRSRMQVIDESTIVSSLDHEPTTHAETNELLENLRSALAELPEKQAAAFVLTQIEGMSYRQAGEALRVTANHITVLVHRARVVLRKRLEQHRLNFSKETSLCPPRK